MCVCWGGLTLLVYIQTVSSHQSSGDMWCMWQGIQATNTCLPWWRLPTRRTEQLLCTVWSSEWRGDEEVQPPSHVRVLCLTSADVRKTPCRVNTWKAAGPDNTAGRFLASNFNLCTIAEVKEVPQINTNIVTNRKNEGRAHNSQRTSNVQCVYYIRLKWMKNCLLETVLVVCGTKCLNDQTVNLHLFLCFYVLTEV